MLEVKESHLPKTKRKDHNEGVLPRFRTSPVSLYIYLIRTPYVPLRTSGLSLTNLPADSRRPPWNPRTGLLELSVTDRGFTVQCLKF